jgi:hypothetical protein
MNILSLVISLVSGAVGGNVAGAAMKEAQAAIAALNGQESNGRALTVNEARPRDDRGSSRGRTSFCAGRRY